MGHINVRTTTVRKKNPDRPQRRIQFRKVTINNQIQKLNNDAAARRNRS